MSSNIEHQARIWRLAGATTRCPEYYEMTPGDGGSCNKFCIAGCGGTGTVYLLGEGVRVTALPCWGKGYRNPCQGRSVEDGDCPTCHGLGYTPSTDLGVWLEAVGQTLECGIEFTPKQNGRWLCTMSITSAYIGEGNTPFEALLIMAECALIGGVRRRHMNVLEEVKSELARAEQRYPVFNSAHEGWGVLFEEVDELWELVKRSKRDEENIQQMRKEAIQVAAMAMRFIKNVCDKETP